MLIVENLLYQRMDINIRNIVVNSMHGKRCINVNVVLMEVEQREKEKKENRLIVKRVEYYLRQ